MKRWPDDWPAGIVRAMALYHPCSDGAHVCGIAPDEQNFITVANFPGVTREQFLSAKAAVGEADGDEYDLVIDLMENSSIIDDFGLRRQMLARLAAHFAKPDGDANG